MSPFYGNFPEVGATANLNIIMPSATWTEKLQPEDKTIHDKI